MIEMLKSYAEYKDASLPWLKQIPASWMIARTKTRFRLSIEKSGIGHGKELLSVYTHIGVRPRKDLEARGNKASTTDDYWVVRKGDIISNKLLAWMGAIGVSHYDGVTSPAYDILRPIQELEPDYYHYLFRTNLYLQLFKSRSRGIMEMRLRLYFDQFGQIPILCPPLTEQRAIVKFLEHVNRKIDKVIRVKKKIIAHLSEQKQAIIQRAVTRGLNTSVPVKPSGVSWLGDIPHHWDVKKLKHLTRFINGFPFKPGDWKAKGIPIIRIQNLNGSKTFNYTNRSNLPAELRICKGDLMFAWSGNKGTSFGSFQWDQPFDGYLNQHIFKLADYQIPSRYFYFVLRAVTRHVEEQAGGIIGLVHVTKPELGSIQVPIASPKEQHEIAAYIDREIARFDTVIIRAKREIELMHEYRAKLSVDVMTGVLDVRDISATLPEEIEVISSEVEDLLEETEEEFIVKEEKV